MKRLLSILSVVGIAMVLISSAACSDSASKTDSALETVRDAEGGDTWTIRGFNFPAWWHDDYELDVTRESLERLAATGANWVAIVPTQYMAHGAASSIAPESGARTVTDSSVAAIIADAQDLDLKVMLKPHVDVRDGMWRGDIMPLDTAAWFDSYRTMIVTYARIAEASGVELFCVGAEFASMESPEYHDEWLGIIADVRRVYSGELTYAASINSFESVTFWDELDYLGLDFYFPISDAATPSLDELIAGWTDYSGFYGEEQDRIGRIEAWQQRWQKQVIFTEIGYRSIEYAARTPWDFEDPGRFSSEVQDRAYRAAYEVLKDKQWFAGMFWWSWDAGGDACGPDNTGYGVCGKPAEDTVTWIYSSGVPGDG